MSEAVNTLMQNGRKLYAKIEKREKGRRKKRVTQDELRRALPALEKEYNVSKENSLRLMLFPPRRNVMHENQPKIRLVVHDIGETQIEQIKEELRAKLERNDVYRISGQVVLMHKYACWMFVVKPEEIDAYDRWARRENSEFATVYFDYMRPPAIPRYEFYTLWQQKLKNDKHARGKILKHVGLLWDGKTSKGQPLKNLNTLLDNFAAGELVLIESNALMRPYVAVVPIYDDLDKQLNVLESVIKYYGDRSVWEEWYNVLGKMFDLYLDLLTTENTYFVSRTKEGVTQISLDDQKNVLYQYCIKRQKRVQFNLVAFANYEHASRLDELVALRMSMRDIFNNLELTSETGGKERVKIEWEEFANRINSRHTMEIPAKKEQRAYIRVVVNRVLNFYAQMVETSMDLWTRLVEKGLYYHNNFMGSIAAISDEMFAWGLACKSEVFGRGWKRIYESNCDEVLESGLFGADFLINIVLLEEWHGVVRNDNSRRLERTITSPLIYILPVPQYIQTPNDRRVLYKRFEQYLIANKHDTVKRVLTFLGVRVDMLEECDGGFLVYVVEDLAFYWVDKIRCTVQFDAFMQHYDPRIDRNLLHRVFSRNNAILCDLSKVEELPFNIVDLIAFLDDSNQAVYQDEQMMIDIPPLEIPEVDY